MAEVEGVKDHDLSLSPRDWIEDGRWTSTQLPTLKQSCGSLSIILQSRMLGKVTRPATASARQLKDCQREASFRSTDNTVRDIARCAKTKKLRKEESMSYASIDTAKFSIIANQVTETLRSFASKPIRSAAALARPSVAAAPSQSTSPPTSKKLICRSLTICRSSSNTTMWEHRSVP